MDREIKFRFWDVKDKVMIDWSTVRQTAFNRGEIHLCYDLMGTNPNFIKMQFTGLEDKNGKDIYDGDIVKFHYFYASGSERGVTESEHELTGVVKWGAFGWGLDAIAGEHWRGYTGYDDGEGKSNFLDLMGMNEQGTHEESFEIVGNIYENPNLLTSQEVNQRLNK